jgi:pantoate--beta-alanine ligase
VKTPILVSTVAELREKIAELRRQGKTIGLVPTMGALHEGHLSLVQASRAECDATVVTIFVNPTQFAPSEDLDAYPRTLEADLQKLADVGTDLVFAPSAEEVYDPNHASWVTVDSVSKPLEGEQRPDHFRGVATVVTKLFNMAQSDVAYFGQKDYQQTLVIRRMVEDLNIPITIRVCPIVREPDGLAKSSRNVYLSPEARSQAILLYKSLCHARERIEQGERDTSVILDQMRSLIQQSELAQIDYITIADAQTLEVVGTLPPEPSPDSAVVIALAVKIDGTRLIDNMLFPE